MFIEKRISGKDLKYYLVHSYRENKKVHKIRKFLGKNIAQNEIARRRKIAEKIILNEIEEFKIKDFSLKEIENINFDEISKSLKKTKISVTHLSEEEWKKFSELFTYNTNAIEGSELTKKEVKDLLEKDLWPKKSKKDISEAYGVKKAIEYIRETKEHLSIELIKKLHKIIFSNSKDFAGSFRKRGQEVVIKNKNQDIVDYGAPQIKVVSLLKELIEWYEKNKIRYSGVILASIVHNQFESIHPFIDGNGRIGRLLLNNILIKNNLPPVNIQIEKVTEYYQSIRKYKEKGEIKLLIDLILKSWREKR